jgi:hypothetical protein
VDTYTDQLPNLEAHIEKNQRSADLLFLTGYHYLACGHPDTALREFRRAQELQPKDGVAAFMVATLAPREATASPPPAQEAGPKSLPSESLVGAWTASGSGTARYSMNLQKDGTFTWSFSRGSRKQEVKGLYTIEGNVLAMEPDSGGIMLAELTAKGADELSFQPVGKAKGDPGLDFKRGQAK